MPEPDLKLLPSIDSLLRRTRVGEAVVAHGRASVRSHLRQIIADLRSEISARKLDAKAGFVEHEIEERLANRISAQAREKIGRVINATGVVIHTNLGRARLGQAAVDALVEVASSYCNLEYNLAEGTRGERAVALERMLAELFECEAATVVNNCAAAVLISLNTLAEGAEVVVSRGELIEIGGSFRIPDVIAKSGARIHEVGTTNRTHLADYKDAINERTRVLLRAHPSNYRVVGFTESPSLASLCALAKEHGLPVVEDLGSGCVEELLSPGIADEPTVRESLKAGASLVMFSGDKLFGGPQAGIILGEASLVARIRKNALFRAVRIDKLTAAALEATVSAYLSDRHRLEIPTLEALHASESELARRARSLRSRANRVASAVTLSLMDGFSVVGGGSAPTSRLATRLLRVNVEGMSASEIETRLRNCQPPIIARIVDDQVVLDLRTVTKKEERELLLGLTNLTTSRLLKDGRRETTE
jgi:L-seryl-tRNA(Ser) seleniumtransferase